MTSLGTDKPWADALGSIHSHGLLLEADVSLRWLAPRAGLGLQPVGSRAGTPEAKWPPGQGHGPALQQTGCLPKSPLNTAGLAHQKAGTRLHPSWASTGPSPGSLQEALDQPRLPGGRLQRKETMARSTQTQSTSPGQTPPPRPAGPAGRERGWDTGHPRQTASAPGQGLTAACRRDHASVSRHRIAQRETDTERGARDVF